MWKKTDLAVLTADLAQPHRLFLAVKRVNTTLVTHSLDIHTSCKLKSRPRLRIYDRPTVLPHTHWTVQCHMPGCTGRHVMTSQWKPTNTADNQHSQDAAVDTCIAHMFCTDLWSTPIALTFNQWRAMVMTIRMQKSRSKVSCSKDRVETNRQRVTLGHITLPANVHSTWLDMQECICSMLGWWGFNGASNRI